MKNLFVFLILLFISHNTSLAQQKEPVKLIVFDIQVLEEIYVIYGISLDQDTVRIISPKISVETYDTLAYKLIDLGNSYTFYLEKAGVVDPKNLIIRVNNKIIWRYNDNEQYIPRFATNIRNLHIIE